MPIFKFIFHSSVVQTKDEQELILNVLKKVANMPNEQILTAWLESVLHPLVVGLHTDAG